MRPFYLFLSLLCLLALTACGTEEELTPPTFSNISASGSLGSTTVLTAPFQDPVITIKGNVDDFSATIVAYSTASGEVPVAFDSNDGSWSFDFTSFAEGANSVSFTASDERGNINQMILTLLYDTTAPLVTSVTQSLEDPLSPQLIITFNEALLESSVTADFCAVDAIPLSGALLDMDLTKMVVTVPLNNGLPLTPGDHLLTCTGVTDLSTPAGNSIAADYSITFTIVE